jgi:DNA-binding NarL/FixJ family response regulator
MILAEIPGVTVVGEACNEAEALELFRRLRPDTIILDVELGPDDGLNVLRQIRKVDQNCFIIMVSSYRDSSYETNSYESGANHYFGKLDAIDGLIAVLRAKLGC